MSAVSNFLPAKPGVGVNRFVGQLGTLDQDCFSVDLKAGERYFFDVQTSGPYAGVVLSLRDANGAVVARGLDEVEQWGEITSGYFSFVAPQDGRFYLSVEAPKDYAWPSWQSDWTNQYVLNAGVLAADDLPDIPAQGRAFTLGTEQFSQMDAALDRDVYRFELSAGQRVHIQIATAEEGRGSQPSIDALVHGPGFSAAVTPVRVFGNGAVHDIIVFSEQGGSYQLELQYIAALFQQPSVEEALRVRTRIDPLQADDHSDGLSNASVLPVGSKLTGSFDGRGDRDWFRLELQAGQRVGLELLMNQAMEDRPQLQLRDAQGKLLQEGASMLAVVPERSGTYYLSTEFAAGTRPLTFPLAYCVESRMLPPEDHANDRVGATRLEPGKSVALSLDGRNDIDVFEFQAVAGQRYAVHLKPIDGSGSAAVFLVEAGAGIPGLNAADPYAKPMLRDDVWYVEASQTGTAHLAVMSKPSSYFGESKRWEISIQPAAADDHPDSSAHARTLELGGVQVGELNAAHDSDWFRVWMEAGQRYRVDFEVNVLQELGGGWNPEPFLSVSLASSGQALPGLRVGGGPETYSQVMEAPSSGWYLLKPEKVQSYGLRVTLEAEKPDDVGSLPALATRFEINTAYQALGLVREGAASADVLNGSSRSDILSGLAGNDVLWGFEGDDWMEGGDGIDTAAYLGWRSSARLTRIESGWQVSTGGEGTDTLVGIERVLFREQGYALDLDGHAGTVVKALGALFGAAAVKEGALVALGLQLLDGGMDTSSLYRLAIGSEPFQKLAGSTSHHAFVDLVYRNVVGHTPTAIEAAPFVEWLDKGQMTQVELALLAAEHPLNALNIDLVGLAQGGVGFDLHG